MCRYAFIPIGRKAFPLILCFPTDGDKCIQKSLVSVKRHSVGLHADLLSYIVDDLLEDFLLVHQEVCFERAFVGECDLKISLVSDKEKRGMLALSYHPSSELASTRLYRVLSEFVIQ